MWPQDWHNIWHELQPPTTNANWIESNEIKWCKMMAVLVGKRGKKMTFAIFLTVVILLRRVFCVFLFLTTLPGAYRNIWKSVKCVSQQWNVQGTRQSTPGINGFSSAWTMKARLHIVPAADGLRHLARWLSGSAPRRPDVSLQSSSALRH